jgi:phosphoserine aminotransferase
MAPLNLIDHLHDAPDYLDTGYWSTLAIKEANRIRPVNVLWSGASEGYRRLPAEGELRFNPSAAYFHYVSNETVEGLQFQRIPGLEDVLCVCDMSSDLLAQPLDMGRYGLVYAHAQKNLGPAGVTVAIIRQDALDRAPESLPKILNYRTHAAANSIYNTPPVFAVYVTVLVTRWLRDEIGGLVAMEAVNRKKAALLYEAIDTSGGFYRGHAAPADRSIMNVSFRLPSPELDKQFAAEALAARLHGLGGHRSVGGVRASIYNAVTVPAVERLCAFMEYFRGMHADQIEPC